MTPPELKRGDFVTLEHKGIQVRAMVALSSGNSKSIACIFDAMFLGYVQMMPLLWERDGYHDLIVQRRIQVTKEHTN